MTNVTYRPLLVLAMVAAYDGSDMSVFPGSQTVRKLCQWFCTGHGGGMAGVCVLVCILLPDQCGFAQPTNASYVVTNDHGYTVRIWTTKQGLPENTITALLQTHDGYLWVGTPDGLACFDGVQFRRYGLQNGLPHVGITCLLEDHQQRLWVGTENGVANCANPRNPSPVFQALLHGHYVVGLAEDAAGNIWIACQNGLYCWTNGQLSRQDEILGLPKQQLTYIYGDHTGAIWVWGSSWKMFKIFKGQATEVPVNFPLPKNKVVRCILEDRTGRIWISTGNGYMIYLENGQWHKLTTKEGVPYDYVSSLAETRDGTIWAGSYGKGLFYFDGNRFQPETQNPAPGDGLIMTLSADAEGNLWAGTSSSGLICLRPKQLTVLGINEGLSNTVVHAITEMPDGSLVVATEGGIYHQIDGRFQRQMNSKADIYPWTQSALATADGNVWWAADTYLFNLKSSLKLGYPKENLPPMPDNNRTLCLFEDRQNRLWVGTQKGLWLQQTNGLTRVRDLPHTGPIRALAQAPDGALWVGTDKAGVYALGTGTNRHYTTQQGLGSDSIRALCFGHDGVLWIGTRSGGLSRLKDGKIFTYTTADGLIDDTVSQILEDDNGVLWLGGNRGISRLYKKNLDAFAAGKLDSLHPLNLGESDGMLTEECSGGQNPSAVKSPSGLLYFATLKGIVVVDPKSFSRPKLPPTTLIESVLVNGHVRRLPYAPADTNSMSQPEAQPEELVLDPGQNNLEFHYTGLHSTTPASIIFRYELETLDHGWIDAGTRRFASYSHVPPGHYRFRVVAAGRDGDWDGTGASLQLFVRPYFYQTWWFLTAALGTGALAIALLVRQAVRRRYQRRVQLLELQQSFEQERQRIARDLHDELGARLTAITHLGDLALEEGQAPDKLKSQLAAITLRVRQMMGTMDEVVWAINPKNDSLPNIVSFLGDYVERFLASTGIGWRLDVDSEFPNLTISAQTRHNLLLAAKETLSNAVRHASPTLIRLRIHHDGSRLEIIISDNGRGFDVRRARPGGNGLKNIAQRMELIKGSAQIESEPGQGTTITLSLPLTNEKD